MNETERRAAVQALEAEIARVAEEARLWAANTRLRPPYVDQIKERCNREVSRLQGVLKGLQQEAAP